MSIKLFGNIIYRDGAVKVPGINGGKSINKITKRLYIGDHFVKASSLRKRGVTHVISAFKDDTKRFKGFTVLYVPMKDDGQKMPAEYWQKTIDFVNAAPADAVFFTHCKRGVNRGPGQGFLVLRVLGYDAKQARKLVLKGRSRAKDRYFAQINKLF